MCREVPCCVIVCNDSCLPSLPTMLSWIKVCLLFSMLIALCWKGLTARIGKFTVLQQLLLVSILESLDGVGDSGVARTRKLAGH